MSELNSKDIGIPNVIVRSMSALMEEFELKSWHIYSGQSNAVMKIRFGSHHNMQTRQPALQPATLAGSEAARSTTTAYCKKSPSRIRRDTHRYRPTLKAKRKRMDNSESLSPENARSMCESTIFEIADSPECVECERSEDLVLVNPASSIKRHVEFTERYSSLDPVIDDAILVMNPIEPISIDFDQIYSCLVPVDGELYSEKTSESKVISEVSPIATCCPCCDHPMENANHVCDSDSDIYSEIDKSEPCCFITDLTQNASLLRPRRVYETAAVIRPPKMHDVDLFRCESCGQYSCHSCMIKYRLKSKFPWYVCCQKMILSPTHAKVKFK